MRVRRGYVATVCSTGGGVELLETVQMSGSDRVRRCFPSLEPFCYGPDPEGVGPDLGSRSFFYDQRRIILDNSWVHQHVRSTLDYTINI